MPAGRLTMAADRSTMAAEDGTRWVKKEVVAVDVVLVVAVAVAG
jgi:hypothetical protein